MDKKKLLDGITKVIKDYGPCENFNGPKGCDVCSARHGPLLALKELRKKAARKVRRTSTGRSHGR